MLTLDPTYFASEAAVAQVGVDEGRLVLQTGLPVPTLEGDINAGFGYWSFLPMGYRFLSGGQTYQIVSRVWLSVPGGIVPRTVFGGDLDLHTCTLTGSTVTWAVRI